MNNFRIFILVLILLTQATPQMFAHHSVSVGFDAVQATTLRGVLSGVDWTNPHVKLSLDVSPPRAR